jgi:hypothetical protein
MWLLLMVQTDGVAIKHARNKREYRLPELSHLSVDLGGRRIIKKKEF